MIEKGSFTVTVPSPLFEELNSIEKGDLGEKFIEYCLKSLLLKEDRDFRTYPRTLSFEKKKVPDFSDDVKGKRKMFEIEAKNLASTTEVSPGWIKEEVLTRFDKSVQNKVLVMFGGDIYSRVPELLKDENVFYIRHISPVSAKDYFDLLWWLKDELLRVPNIRKRAAVAISRNWHGILAPWFPLVLIEGKKPFLTFRLERKPKPRFILRSFPKMEWEGGEIEIYNNALSLEVNGMHEWVEEWKEIYPFFEEDNLIDIKRG